MAPQGNILHMPTSGPKLFPTHAQSFLNENTPESQEMETAEITIPSAEDDVLLSSYILTMRRYIGSDVFTFCAQESTPSLNVTISLTNIPLTANPTVFLDWVRDIKKDNKCGKDNDLPGTPNMHLFNYTTDKLIQQANTARLSLNLTAFDDSTLTASLSWYKGSLNSKVGQFFLESFANCCQNFAACKTVAELFEMMSPKEERELLAVMSNEEPHPSSLPLPSLLSLFDKNVEQSPKSIAVIEPWSNTSYTYSKLDGASKKIAAFLQQRFSTQELTITPIILLMEKDFSCVASVIGVWRAGGHFLPIDGIEKLRALDAKNYLGALTNFEKMVLDTSPDEDFDVIEVKDLLKMELKFQDSNKPFLNHGHLPAYTLTTSGTSTGTPKQFTISQKALSIFAAGSKKAFPLDSNRNILQWVPFSFDVFFSDLVKSIFCTNGTLTMLRSKDRMDIPLLAKYISNSKVNFLQMSPQFALFALKENSSFMKDVETLVLGGEILEWRTLAEIREIVGDSKLKVFNGYGLTEATIESTVYPVPTVLHEEESYASVPIGHPLSGVTMKILDPILHNQMPIGSTGIIAIAGDTIGNGDPLEKVVLEGKEYLLTGDWGKVHANGLLEFKGRDNDKFVKITGGLRINCGDVEGKISKILGRKAVALSVKVEKGKVILAAVIQTKEEIDAQQLQDDLRKELSYYMVPQIVFCLKEAWPLTGNGKVDKNLLGSLALKEYEKMTMTGDGTIGKINETEMELISELSLVTGRNEDSIKANINLRDQGFTSFELMKFANVLLKKFTTFKGISDLFSYPSISLLAESILSKKELTINNSDTPKKVNPNTDPICIVGVSFRLPNNEETNIITSTSIPSFWSTLTDGKTLTSAMPSSRVQDVLTRMPKPFTSSAIKASFLPRIDQFDHEFFKIAPSEAKHMCPEQRLFLEVGTEALLDSGYNLGQLDSSNISVYTTASDIQYGLVDQDLSGVAVVGRQSSVVPSRLSYTFNLKGGNYVVDTACSAAFTVLEQAVRDLQTDDDLEAAVVGGVNIYLYPAEDGLMGTNLIHSREYKCLPFDSRADGTVSGEGVFAYVLKRRSKVSESDYIYGVIESIASNAVGRGNGITAPSVESQVACINKALAKAGVGISDISYLETHGTGTVLGDQIELCALGTAFAGREEPLRIGASKQVYGHLDMVAGFLSILKASTALSLKKAPALEHIKERSGYLDGSVLNTEGGELSKEEEKLYAGVSAYGLSGTNCHVVISQKGHKEKEAKPISFVPQHFLLPITDNPRIPLESQCISYSNYATFWQQHNITLEDICGTQIQNLINLNKSEMLVGIIEASSFEEFVRKLDAIGNGVTVLGSGQIMTMTAEEMTKYLPNDCPYKRAPNLPKYIYKNTRHWLPEVERMEEKKQESNNNDQLAKILSLLENKSAEVQKILNVGQQFEQLVRGFTFSLLKDSVLNNSENNNGSENLSNVVRQTEMPTEDGEPLTHDLLTYSKCLNIITKIWQDSLETEDISTTDIFRDLGGDSLLTVQMANIVSQKLQIKVKAADAFMAPSLGAFAALVFHKIQQSRSNNTIPRGDQLLGMPNKMLLFPGQGSQKVGMCQSLKNSEKAMKLFETANAITGIDILSNSLNPEALSSTEFVQVALFVGSLAKIAQIQEDSPDLLTGTRFVGGLSVGEFAALVHAEAISFEDALKIVHFRGKVMQQEVERTQTGMVSVFGPDPTQFGTWLFNNFPDLKFCTFLGDNQFTIGGPLKSCEQAVEILENNAEQLGIIDTRLLRVAGAFHTEWMKEAGIETAKMIDKLEIRYPKFGIIMNADGKVAMNKDSIRFNLKKQTTSCVLWRNCMKSAVEVVGIRRFLEISPSSVLGPVLKKRIKFEGVNVEEMRLERF